MERKLELGDVLVHINVTRLIGVKESERIIERQRNCDWESIDPNEESLNNIAVKNNHRVVSTFCHPTGETIMVITEANRRLTLMVLPQDYNRAYLAFMQLKQSQKKE